MSIVLWTIAASCRDDAIQGKQVHAKAADDMYFVPDTILLAGFVLVRYVLDLGIPMAHSMLIYEVANVAREAPK